VWQGGLRFHAHDAWPEPGDLRRTGPCLMEFAPSGAYVEDWRLQPGSAGPFLSLRLLSETDLRHGHILRDNGLLVQAGDHVMLVLGRRVAIPRRAPLSELVNEFRGDKNQLSALLDLQCSYAVRSGPAAGFVIGKSTLPFVEGQPLDSFSPPQQDGTVIQLTGHSKRCWRIETIYGQAEI
jgi:hypothetical protein